MANPEHLARLQQGVTEWNQWRSQHPTIVPDLRGPGLPEGVVSGLRTLVVYLARLTQVGMGCAVIVVLLWRLQMAVAPTAVAVLFLINQLLILGLVVLAIVMPLAIVGWAIQMMLTVLQGHDLNCLSLRGANLSRAKLMGANLDGLDLRAVNFYAADLRFAHLRSTDLQQANLSRANLFLTDLQGANLSYANLRQACLIWTNFGKANLKGAMLSEATCWLANFRESQLEHTTMPNGQIRDR
ncbi:pentapeptide repeat-containing protein [Trichothermofontia sp.]